MRRSLRGTPPHPRALRGTPPRLWAFGVAGVALVGALVALSTLTSDPAPEAETVVTVVDLAPGQVEGLVVEVGNRRVELTRDGEGTWRSGPGTPPQSAILAFNVEDRLLPIRGYKALSADPDDPQYALGEPAVTVHIEGAGSARQTVHFGGSSYTGGGFYARRPGEKGRLYLVPRQTMDDFRSLAEGRPFRSPDVLQDKLDELQAEAELGGEDLTGGGPADGATRVRPYLRQAIEAEGRDPGVSE